MGTKSAWTPERRAMQAEIISQTRPWEQSTGPRTDTGKQISAQNARMRPMRAALHAVRSVGVIDRNILRHCMKMAHGKPLPLFSKGEVDFEEATAEEWQELDDLNAKRDALIAAAFGLLPSEEELRAQDMRAAAAIIEQFSAIESMSSFDVMIGDDHQLENDFDATGCIDPDQ